jgi:hypothetical protein
MYVLLVTRTLTCDMSVSQSNADKFSDKLLSYQDIGFRNPHEMFPYSPTYSKTGVFLVKFPAGWGAKCSHR